MFCRLRLSIFIITFSFLISNFYQCKSDDNIIDKNINEEESNEYDFVFDLSKTYFGKPLTNTYANKIGNEYSEEKITLGLKLFNDKRLSKDNTVSCASCHDLKNGGADNTAVSKGIKNRKGTRNAPTVINAALHFKQFWDGRAGDIEKQVSGPILNSIEMGMESKEKVVSKIKGIKEYQKLFKNAFPKSSEPITFEKITKSIASFERTLIQPSRFDNYLAGDKKALNNKEKKGVYLFIHNKCFQCHQGNLIGGLKFSTFGTVDRPYWNFTGSESRDKGVFNITKAPVDYLNFKVPSLRNVAKTAPYFHDGSIKSLPKAIKIMAKIQFDVDLSDDDAKNIEAFLKTLTSEGNF